MDLCSAVCGWVHVHLFEQPRGGQKSMLGVYLNHLPLHFLRHNFSLNLELAMFVCLGSKPQDGSLPVCISPRPEL